MLFNTINDVVENSKIQLFIEKSAYITTTLQINLYIIFIAKYIILSGL